MRMPLACLCVLLLGSLPALARDAKPLDLSLVPQEGQAPEKFVPPGWKIEVSARGDLDGNGSEDLALSLREVTAGPDADGNEEEYARALVVLLADGGKFRRAAASNKVLGCSSCTVTEAGKGDMVRIEKGVVVLTQILPDSKRDVVMRFRHEPKEQRFVFLGDDVWDSGKKWDQGVIVHTFPLEGRKLTETLRYSGGQGKLLSTKKGKMPVRKQYLEDLDIQKYFS